MGTVTQHSHAITTRPILPPCATVEPHRNWPAFQYKPNLAEVLPTEEEWFIEVEAGPTIVRMPQIGLIGVQE